MFTGQRMRVVLPEIVGTDIYRHRYIEPALTRVLLHRLRSGMVFVDVGAHYGYYSVIASQLVERSGVVLAFEPGRGTFQLLLRNVHGLENVRAHQVALHSERGVMELHDFGLRHSALNTIMASARVPVAERRQLRGVKYAVSTVTLDEFLSASGLLPDMIKLDAEGSELSILQGMRRVLTEGAPMITLETGDYMGMPDTAPCIDFLDNLGYRCLEYAEGLRPHRRRSRYGYGNLYFVRAA